MPEQNEPIQGAFGGVYNASLPELQQTEQQIGQQQIYQARLQQQQTAREQAMYDRMQQAEVNKILPNDVPEFSNLYSQYRAAQIAADTGKFGNSSKGITARAQANNQAAQLFGQAMKFSNDSIQQKQNQANLLAQYKNASTRPLLADNFTDLMEKAQNTPTSQLKSVNIGGQTYDLTNLDSYKYPGANFKDMPKILQGAEGKPNKNTVSEPADEKGIQNRITTYQFGALPAQYKQSVQQGLASTPQGARYAAYEVAHIPDGAMANLNTQVAAIPASKWKQMGLDGPQSLEPVNPDDPAEVLASYLAKQRLINTNPSVAGIKMETNLGNEMFQKASLQLGNQEIMEGIRHGNAMKLKQFGIDYAKQSAQDQTATNEYYVDKDYQDAQNPKEGGKSVIGPDGQIEYESPGNAILQGLKPFTAGSGKTFSKSDAIRYNDDGSKMRGVFYLRDKNNNPIPDGQGGFKEDPNKGGWVDRESVKALVGNQFKSLHQPAPAGQSPKTETFPADQNPANWKQVGSNYQYKDGTIWDANGKRVK